MLLFLRRPQEFCAHHWSDGKRCQQRHYNSRAQRHGEHPARHGGGVGWCATRAGRNVGRLEVRSRHDDVRHLKPAEQVGIEEAFSLEIKCQDKSKKSHADNSCKHYHFTELAQLMKVPYRISPHKPACQGDHRQKKKPGKKN